MKKILLIEDDAFLNQLYSDLLKQEKYEVTSVKDGLEAYNKINESDWDLILLDVMLPGMTGFEILDKVNKEKKVKAPIIFMTNLDSSDSDKKALQKAKDYWIKSSMTPPEFIQKVKNVLH